MDLSQLWEAYELDNFKEGMTSLFPDADISLEVLMSYIFEGNITDAAGYLGKGILQNISEPFGSAKEIFIRLLVIGITSALLGFFVQIFERHQITEIGFYIMYLLVMMVLFVCFRQMTDIAGRALENIVLFVKLLIPTYLIAVGVATGLTTVGVFAQFLILVIYIVEKILLSFCIPLSEAYFLLIMINGVWMEEKLNLIISLLKKVLNFILKSAVGVVMSVGVFQAVLTPAIDHVKNGVWEKAVSSLPWIGNAAGNVVEMLIGSAVVIKNGLGVILAILLFAVCAMPVLQMALVTAAVKTAAAFMGIISDRKLTDCVNKAGDAMAVLLKMTATAMFLFIIIIMILAMAGSS